MVVCKEIIPVIQVKDGSALRLLFFEKKFKCTKEEIIIE